MGQKSIAIIHSEHESSWVSCQSIARNLVTAYQEIFKGDKIEYFSHSNNPENDWELARGLHRFSPDRLIFVDHKPHPASLLQALEILYGRRSLPPLYFHVYGDFTLYSKEWMSVEPLLKKTRLKFICASPRQAALVRKFISRKTMKNAVEVCHFPIDTGRFFFDPKQGQLWRKKLKITKEELVVIYSGRLSLQKNPLALIRELSKFTQVFNIPTKLLIAGPFDNIAAPFFGLHYPNGFYFSYWNEHIEKLPEAFRKNVIMLGAMSSEELRGLYSASDIYVSLSLHHDEDYGMAPAEALCCGLPASLTDWGGFASFSMTEKDCQLLPVSLGKNGLEVFLWPLRKNLWTISAKPTNAEERSERSVRCGSKLSIKAAAELLREFHGESAPVFKGFSSTLARYARSISTEFLLYKKGLKPSTFYEEIYGNYLQR